jgi:CheY-like chemotaxis protein
MQGRRFLVADDNPVNQAVTRTVLAKAGCEVRIVANGREALAALADAGAVFDAVLMDMEMPEMDGLAATRAIRAAGRTALPIIGLTGNDRESDRTSCMLAGMTDYLAKPFSPSALFEVILRHVEHDPATPPLPGRSLEE